MFSRFVGCLLLASNLALLGCGLHLGEEPPPPVSPKFNGHGYACVSQIPLHLDAYINDRLSEEEISNFVYCLEKSFVAFAQYTRGRDQKSYSPEELRAFMANYFMRNHPINDEFLHQIMLIKQLMVGGSAGSVTRTELFALIDFMEEIRQEAIRLKPHLRFLNARLAERQDMHDLGERISEARDALNASIQNLAARMRKSPHSYAFADLKSFMSEFRSFVRWEEHFTKSADVSAWVEFFRAFKSITVSPETPDAIRSADWTPFMQSLARWYLMYLQYQVGVKSKTSNGQVETLQFYEGVRLRNVVFLGQGVFRLINEALEHQPLPHVISKEQILNMVKALQGMGWLSPAIRGCSVVSALDATTSRLFGDERIPVIQRRVEGLRPAALALLQADFDQWAFIQMNLQKRYHPKDQAGNVPVLGHPSLSPEVRWQLAESGDSSWIDFLSVKKRMRPLFSEKSLLMYVLPERDLQGYGVTNGFYNLSMMNLIRSVVGIIYRGYTDGALERGWEAGITREALQKFYEDFRDLGIDLGILDRRNLKAGRRAFMEGSLFTYSATGLKSEMNMVEAMELVSHLFSGSRLANSLYADLARVCTRGPLDINGQETIDRRCVQQRLAGDMLVDHIPNIPGLRSFLEVFPDVRKDYGNTFLEAVFVPGKSDKDWVEANELSVLSVVLHYAEAMLTRYDTNHDGILNSQELDRASDVMVGFIQWYAKERMGMDLSEAYARDVFSYILYYQKMPTGADAVYVFVHGVRRSVVPLPLHLDRMDVARILRMIIGKLLEGRPTDTEQANGLAACHK